MADGHSKKVTDSLRARRTSQGAVAVAGFSPRRRTPRIRGRVWLSHLHDTPESQGSQREEGLRQGPKKPWQEHHSHIAAITLQGAMGESMTIEGATDTLAFEAYVEHFL